MTLIEMEGFLKGKCLPGDLKVGETNAQYLHRKLNAVAELQRKVEALAVENASLIEVNSDRRMFIMNGVQLGYIKVPTVETDPALETIRLAVSPQEPTPATDAALAEIHDRFINDAVSAITNSGAQTVGDAIVAVASMRKEAGQ